MTFGERLVYYRTKKQLTQKALAEALGVTNTRLNYWEKDKREPDVEMVRHLSDALGVSADILIGRKEDDEIKKAPAPEDAGDELSVEEVRKFLCAYGFIDEADSDISESDVQFVSGMFDMLDAWFSRR